jgi:hypothetical protein
VESCLPKAGTLEGTVATVVLVLVLLLVLDCEKCHPGGIVSALRVKQ